MPRQPDNTRNGNTSGPYEVDGLGMVGFVKGKKTPPDLWDPTRTRKDVVNHTTSGFELEEGKDGKS